MRIGIVGTGTVAHKHALAYRNIGFEIVACTNRTVTTGEQFAALHNAEFVPTWQELCTHPLVEYVDVCTFPHFRLPVVELCAQTGKHVLVEKPVAIDLPTADAMIALAAEAGIQLGVVSQHRLDDSVLFLKRALQEDRLGRILQANAFVPWYRSPAYYSRSIKGSWAGEGGGALISQAIHQLDLLLFLVGPVSRAFGEWQLGGFHSIEAEDSVSAVCRYASGALGLVQASTAVWPGYPERIEIHGTKGTAILVGDKLITWDVQEDAGEVPPLDSVSASGASEPMAISTTSFERQFLDFAHACRSGRAPLSSGEDGRRALQFVLGVYESCRTEHCVAFTQ